MRIDTSASVYDIAKQFDSIVENAQRDLADKGLRLGDGLDGRPVMGNGQYYNGRLPSNLDMLPNHDLVELMSVHAAWVAYVNTVLGDAQAKLGVAKAKEKATRASIIKELGKDCVDSDKRYIDVAADLAYHTVFMGYVEAIKATASSDYKTLSRIITVRGQDQEMTARVGNASRGY